MLLDILAIIAIIVVLALVARLFLRAHKELGPQKAVWTIKSQFSNDDRWWEIRRDGLALSEDIVKKYQPWWWDRGPSIYHQREAAKVCRRMAKAEREGRYPPKQQLGRPDGHILIADTTIPTTDLRVQERV